MTGTTGNFIVFRQFKIHQNKKLNTVMTKQGKNNHIALSLILSMMLFPDLSGQIEFTYQSDYYYVKGKDASSLPGSWMNPGFDYSGWTKGKAPFRYGNGTGGTELTDMQNSYTSVYLRSTFECSNKDLIKELSIIADYDDGFIIWVNGAVALSINAPSNPLFNSVAPANHESGTGIAYTVSTALLNLTDGINYIAVQGFNVSLTSTDFYVDIEIHGEQNLPQLIDSSGIDFSVQSGFYENPFSLVLSSIDASAQITYTLDGSNPQNSTTGFTSDQPVTIAINPESTAGRPATPSVIVRASASKPGYKPAISSSRTYIFAEKVRTQSWPGGGWPSFDINGQFIDLAMDPEVVNDPAYSGQIISSLLGIPSISIITDIKNLFDPASGIYVNAQGHGLEWERECSAELINPDGTPGFNVNAGLRIRGGWSRNYDFPKHAFRLFFREKYGNDKLRYPLFGDEGVDEFDKIDLRSEQNYAWSTGDPFNSMVREVFSRDTQRDMDQPYTRSRYYHLYLNGMYWGLFQSQERSEARYAESYFGGSEEEYDVVKVNTETGYLVEATDGSLDSWQKLYNMCQKGFASNADYFKIEGKDENGKPVKGGEIMVDLDNLIDFMSIIFYTGNFDSPTAVFMQNKKANNFYAIDNRTDKSKGFTFYIHDAEHSLFDEVHSPGMGLYEDRVNIGTRTDNLRMEVSDLSRFHPQWLHYKLSANPEYRTRFADRAWKHFSGRGVFSPDSALVRLNKRINEVDPAVIAESARWGDAKRTGAPYTKIKQWIPEVEKIRNRFIPLRTNIVIEQLKQVGLYSLILAPVIKNQANILDASDIVFNSPMSIRIENPNSKGTIYYTLNGTDPRKTGGGVNIGSMFSLNTISLNISASAQIKARILSDGQWSALQQISFINQKEDYSNFRITELHYHPPDYISGSDTTEGQDLEFLEFKNTGNNSINLGGLVVDSAVHYTFPGKTLLPPKQFYVIASKTKKFFVYYGMLPSGNYQGNFSNTGEEILLSDPEGSEILDFNYDDSSPWPSEADGQGFSLSSSVINPTGSPGDYSYWTLSVVKDGTPFADNVLAVPEPPDSRDKGILSAWPNPTTGTVTLQLSTDEEVIKMDLMVFTITGKLIRRITIGNPGLIDLTSFGLPAGVYICKVSTPKYSSRTAVILTK
jgi:hypothetical protein